MWFATGLGLALLTFSILGPADRADTEAPEIQPAASASTNPPRSGESAQAATRDTGSASAGRPTEAKAEQTAAATMPKTQGLGEPLSLTVKRGDSLDRLFKRHGLNRTDLANIMELELARKHLRLIKPGDDIEVLHDDGSLLRLARPVSLTESLAVTREGEVFSAELVVRPLDRRTAMASGTINSSLFLAAAEAGVSDRTIMNLAGIFAWDIDFVLDIRRGDQFRLIYEELWRDGERLGEGTILAAEFTNRGDVFRAVRFADASGRVDYYTPEGKSLRKAFLRAPLSFSRVSSNFNLRRRHPVLNTIRAHRGVDYAAPTGTPVKAAGDGKVIFRGRKGGYGNTVIVQHGGNIDTLYAHLSKFGKARSGSRVRQGQTIGYVGSTGLATGPHLHYEYRINGVHKNPRTVKLPDAAPIDSAYLADFQAAAADLLQQLQDQRPLMAADAIRPPS